MTTKKGRGPSRRPRPDLHSNKKEGFVTQGIRISVDENKLIRQAAEIERRSINAWAVDALVNAAKKVIRAAEREEG